MSQTISKLSVYHIHTRSPNKPTTTMCVQLSTELCISRRRFIKSMKPLLPRKRSSSARINLNRHWNELEELYGETYRTRVTHFETLLLHNELNDNALNEAREAAAAAASVSTTRIEDHPMPEEDLLTPPPTPFPGAQRTFDFTIVEEEDITDHDLPLTPSTPETPEGAWNVFTFPQGPSTTTTTSSSITTSTSTTH